MAISHARRISLVLGAGIVCALLIPTASTFAADDGMAWQFSEGNDPDNKGRMAARLSYGVPETDNVQVSGVCDAAPSTGAKYASVTFGADTGDLKEGEEVELRFTGGGFDHAMRGSVYGTQAEFGVSGVHVDIAHDDPLWQALLGKPEIDYLVPGYRASSLKLADGKDRIKSFITACRTYAEAILGEDKAKANSAGAGSDPSEKAAFESAKELGTVEAWNAFLASYPSGFHADLARAYIKKLGDDSKARDPSVSGRNVTFVEYQAGVFVKNGPDTWVEQKKAGGDALRFKETSRSDDEVKLFDKRRKVHISLRIAHGEIWYALSDAPLSKLYDIVAVRGGADVAPPPPIPTAAPALPKKAATKVSCRRLGKIRSKYSNRPAKITFVNNSGMYRSILWLDFKGRPKEYANLNAGEQVTLDTYLSHPWMVTDGPGNCIQIALPRSGASVVKLGRVKAAKPTKKKKKTVKKRRCAKGRMLIEGKCIKRQDAASFCGPGYRVEGNKCVQGYRPPKPQKQLPSWQLEAIQKGCKPGLAWNPQEGCHEND